MRPAHCLALLLAGCGLAAHAQSPLGLGEAIRLADTASPQLAAQRSAAQSAAALVGPSTELPDPRISFGAQNLPVRERSVARDPHLTGAAPNELMNMWSVGISQEFVRPEKRAARGARATAESRREEALLESRRADLHRDVALAWFDRFNAARSRGVVESLLEEATLQARASQAQLASGSAPATESIAARALRATLADRRQEFERQERRAVVMLERWLGPAAQRPPGEAPDISRLSRAVRRLVIDIHEHPQLATFAFARDVAQADLQLAAAATKPDWSVELTYGSRAWNGNSDMVSLMVKMDLPLFSSTRQAPVVDARRRGLERAVAEAEDATQRHQAEIRVSLVDWEVARERVTRHREELVPLAEERGRLALAAYEGGRGDLSAVLDARRGVLEARLAAIAAEAELARAWSHLAYVVPEDSP